MDKEKTKKDEEFEKVVTEIEEHSKNIKTLDNILDKLKTLKKDVKESKETTQYKGFETTKRKFKTTEDLVNVVKPIIKKITDENFTLVELKIIAMLITDYVEHTNIKAHISILGD